MLNKPKKSCSECGGSNNGVCKTILLNGPQTGCLPPGCGFFCQCDEGSGGNGNSPTTQLVTSVVNGKTITGTFTPTTLSQYSSLRASTTITTSENGHETALVVLAGGVAWALANWAQLGAAGAALTGEGLPEPDGAEEDDKGCSKPEKKCSDCGGKNAIGLCSSGSEANCPCDDDEKCPTGDDQPKCKDTDCAGNDSHKCTQGPHKDCDCKPDDKCPDFVTCDNCGGNDSNGKCKGISDQNDKWKGCDCYDIISDDDVTEYEPFSDLELLAQDAFLSSLASGGGAQAPPDRGHPSSDPKCADNQVPGLKLVNKVKTSSSAKTPKEILYIMRETLCNDKCENPPDIPQKSVFATPDGDGCEIAIAIESGVEAWAYRGTHSQGPQWQDCWDSTMNITETCVKDSLATGWVNGPDDYEFFQLGYRPINGKGSKHKAQFGNDTPLEHWCPNAKPSCDTCFGGGNGNICSSGDNQGCACEPVTITQPAAPKVTNCATAVAAAEISCCNGGASGYAACSNEIQGCGVIPNLEAICQSPVSAANTYQVCGQFTEDGGIVKGSNQEDIATCLDGKFHLNGQWRYA
ncbi:MAG: hypothetical protein Q9160_007889 [Pyrenula sp. 1 TL-2023]